MGTNIAVTALLWRVWRILAVWLLSVGGRTILGWGLIRIGTEGLWIWAVLLAGRGRRWRSRVILLSEALAAVLARRRRRQLLLLLWLLWLSIWIPRLQ